MIPPLSGRDCSGPQGNGIRCLLLLTRYEEELLEGGGWDPLFDLPTDELDRITELERAGNLTDEALAHVIAAARLGQP